MGSKNLVYQNRIKKIKVTWEPEELRKKRKWVRAKKTQNRGELEKELGHEF